MTEERNVNILIIGGAGVGKSTLIRSILKKDLSVEENTSGFQEYKVPDSPMTLIESEGFELQDLNEFKDRINQEIEARSSIDTKRIHMIWYVIRSVANRFFDGENGMINEWRDKGITVIIILNSTFPDNEYMNTLKSHYGYPTCEDLVASDKVQQIMDMKIITTVLVPKMKIADNKDQTIQTASFGVRRLIELSKLYLSLENRNIEIIKVDNMLQRLIKTIRGESLNMLNIMVLGDSEYGKIQLLNTLLGLDVVELNNLAKTGNIAQYKLIEEHISITDFVDFDNYRSNVVKAEVSRRLTEETNNSIHIIWYITNDMDRFIDEKAEFISEIMELKIPIIIILNGSEAPRLELKRYLMRGGIRGIKIPDLYEILNCQKENRNELINKKASIIKTNAKQVKYDDKIVSPIYGISELIVLTQLYIEATIGK